MIDPRYAKSDAFLAETLQYIPLGSQTFSKSITQFPRGVSPFFIERGKGCKIWDIDGNEYLDFVNSLGAVMLGYSDPDVNRAVQAQLEDGVSFSLAHPLELKVAKKIREIVPNAELIRYGKNGSDTTAAAIRLARAFTKRDHVANCGYHGWQDWYIGSTARNLGVPKAVCELTHPFLYNNIESLHKLFKDYPDQIAAVIMEPMNMFFPEKNFLGEVKDLAHKYGAVLIFDETITGFRHSRGGAQELFGVRADLVSYGKGMSNGFPLSAITGRGDIMRLMEEIFFSFTVGGETLSLTACDVVLTKLQKEPVNQFIATQGKKIIAGVNARIEKLNLAHIFGIQGHPVYNHFVFKDTPHYSQWHAKTLFMQEVFKRGIFTYGSHVMSYAHKDAEVARLLAVYDEVFPILKQAIDDKQMDKLLHCKPIVPLFKIR